MKRTNRNVLICGVVASLLILVVILSVGYKRNAQERLFLNEDMGFSLSVSYFDENRTKQRLSYSTPSVDVTVTGDSKHQIKELDQSTLKEYAEALAKLERCKYTLASMSEVLNDVPTCELLLDTLDGDHVYLVITDTGDVYQRLDEIIPNKTVVVGSAKLLLKYEGGKTLFNLIKESISEML